MTRHHRHSFLLVVAVVISSLLSGCAGSTKDGEPDTPTVETGVPTEVSITLSSRSMLASGTRADGGQPADPDDDNEKINDWFLAFVHKQGTVSKILKRSGAMPSGTAPFEEETFKCVIPSGTYSIYAFANITPEELTKASGVTFAEGTTLKPEEQEAIQKGVWRDELNLWEIRKKPIPMTGYLPNVKIRDKVEENFSIEVVRMLAKVDFLFYNNTKNPIKVVGVGLDPVTTTPVSLFPTGKDGISYSHLGKEAYTPLDNAEYGRLMYMPTASWTVPANTPAATTQKDKAVRNRFYFKESLSLRNNGGLFTVWLDVEHSDGERSISISQFNVTNDINGYINRNDWLVIPIELSKYAVRVDAFFYPPIGGYPAYLSTTDPDGSQVFTFGTQGEFCIVPQVIDKETGEHLSPTLYSFEIVENSIEDPDKIFKVAPAISPTASSSLPDEILGTLDTKEGSAAVTIKVKVKASPTDTDPLTFMRTIHIIRDNKVKPSITTD